MASRIKLVRGDTRPTLIVTLIDRQLGEPLDMSAVGTTVVMYFRAVGGDEVLATVEGTRLTGLELEDKSITEVSPYDQPGRGGRVAFAWHQTTALDNEPGYYEGEVEVTFPDATIQTVYDKLKFSLREQVG